MNRRRFFGLGAGSVAAAALSACDSFGPKSATSLLKFAERLNDSGVLEGMPKMEGKRMLAIWAPKPQKKKEKNA